MKVEKTPMKTVRVRAYCNDCEGEMEYTGTTFTVHPPLYEHKCSSCGKKENSHNLYPDVVFEDIKKEIT